MSYIASSDKITRPTIWSHVLLELLPAYNYMSLVIALFAKNYVSDNLFKVCFKQLNNSLIFKYSSQVMVTCISQLHMCTAR